MLPFSALLLGAGLQKELSLHERSAMAADIFFRLKTQVATYLLG
jgi:hypothetical protein